MNKLVGYLIRDIKDYYKNHMTIISVRKEYLDIKKINIKDVGKITMEIYKNISKLKNINGISSEYYIDIKKYNGEMKETFHIKFEICVDGKKIKIIFYKNVKDEYILQCSFDKIIKNE